MSSKDQGQQILEGLKEARTFFTDVSRLLREAEDKLREEGWRVHPKLGNESAFITSHVFTPQRWMPRYIYRYYVVDEGREDHRDLILFIGVLLDQDGHWQGFDQPWVTCGIYRFDADHDPKELSLKKETGEEWIRSHLVKERSPDGSFFRYSSTPEEQETFLGNIYRAHFALPLTAIGCPTDVKAKMIDPLLQEVDQITVGDAKRNAGRK